MKNVYFLLITIFCIQCIELQNQITLSMELKKHQLSITNTGRAIMLMAELHGKKLDDLIKALQVMMDSIDGRIAEENNCYQSSKTSFSADREFYQKQLSQYKAKLAYIQVESRTVNKSISDLQGQIDDKQNELMKMDYQKQFVIRSMDDDEKNVKQRTQTLNKGIILLDQALELLNQAKQGSFIETHSESYSVIGDALSNDLEVQYRAIGQAFIDISQTKFADHEMVRRSIRILQKLRNNYSDQIQGLTSQFQAQQQQYKILLKQYEDKNNQVGDYINVLQLQMKQLTDSQNTRNKLMNVTSEAIKDYEGSLNRLEDESRQFENNHQQQIKEYEKEKQIIEDCLNSIKNMN